MIKTTLTVLALAIAAVSAGNAYAAEFVAVTPKMKLVKSEPFAPRIKLTRPSKIGCNEISKTIIVDGIPYTAKKCN